MSNKFEGIIENICSQPRVAGSYIVDIPDEEMPAFFGICSAKNLPLEVWNAIAVFENFYI